MAIAYDRYQHDPAAAAKAKAAYEATQAQAAGAEAARTKAGREGYSPLGGRRSQMYADLERAATAKLYDAYNQRSAAKRASDGAAVNPQKQAETQVMDATFGQGNAINDDPRVTAALDALNPANVQSNQYAQMTDANAAQAGAMADMQRQQFAAAGIGLNDPAAQARMRQVETARMQGNNAALGQSQQAGMGAAAQQAQLRLSQMGLAQGAYSQGASMLANKQFGQTNQSAGYQTQVPTPTPGGEYGGDVFQAWQAPTKTQAPAKPAATAAAPAQKPAAMTVAQRNAAQAAWKASQGGVPASYAKPAPTQKPTTGGVPWGAGRQY